MELAYRGSVNRWECDENDHMNVRFYVQRHWQTLCSGLTQAGLQPAVADLQVQHIRYLAEARIATPLSGYWGVVADPTDRNGFYVFTELRQSFTQQCLSSALHYLSLPPLPVDAVVNPDSGPRGIAHDDLVFTQLSYTELADYGLQLIGAGLIETPEVASDGTVYLHHYMGRLSDSMPHLWGRLAAEADGRLAGQGGAVLEYRLRYHRSLRLGERFEIWSGLVQAGAKIQRFAHLLFAPETGELVLSAEAVGVRMDLQTRKAVQFNAADVAQMQQHALKLPT